MAVEILRWKIWLPKILTGKNPVKPKTSQKKIPLGPQLIDLYMHSKNQKMGSTWGFPVKNSKIQQVNTAWSSKIWNYTNLKILG